MADTAKETKGSERRLPEHVLTTDELLAAEAKELGNPPELAALCLSGGGIRSAAFALGVVQALARKDLLPCFHYLSTVSGGGYLGSFLCRWIQEQGQDVSAVQRCLAQTSEVEPSPLRWLRENSNFITPRIGLASADTWTAIAMSVRNILVNWLIFAPALLLVVAFPYWGAALLAAAGGWVADAFLIVGVLLIGVATATGARALPSHLPQARRWDGQMVFKRIVLPASFGSAALGVGIAPRLAWLDIGGNPNPDWHFIPQNWFASSGIDPTTQTFILAFLAIIVPMIAGYCVGWIVAASEGHRNLARSNHRAFLWNVPVWLIGVLVSAAFYVWGFALLAEVGCNLQANAPLPCAWRRDVFAAFLVGWGILAQLVVTIVFVAFRRIPHGEELSPDLDREWLARLSAQKIRLALAWTLFAAGALLLGHLLTGILAPIVAQLADEAPAKKATTVLQWVTGFLGAVSGAIAILGGKTANTGYRPDAGSAKKLFSFDIIVAISTFIFILVLLYFIGQIEFSFADWFALQLRDYEWVEGAWSMVAGHVVVMCLFGLALAWTSTRINVNRFSLNGMYRNRLARTFLGAARKIRDDADPFTGFAPSDNIRLHTLKAVNRGTGHRVLMPVVNVALNLVGGPRLAWQERKAQAFVFTPLACGSAALAEELISAHCEGRYVRSEVYGGNEPDLGLPGDGVSLASAIAISGAAASPSMGYHSSPATAFLMTLFNVRLGAWLPNPHRCDLPVADMQSSAPRNALRPLLRELLGLTDAQGRSVYLSDGGHFENLGLYEMVRRRCRFVVVSDAGCDPNASFEDLGNAIRKIRIDLGINIVIDTVNIASREKWQRNTSTYFAMGTIHYPHDEGEGKLLYIKPACHHEIPADVRAYALSRKDFPHESTGDQWFSESQFESYRSLGANLVDRLGAQSPNGTPKSYADCDLKTFFDDVHATAEKTREQPADPSTVTAGSDATAPSNVNTQGPPGGGVLDISEAPDKTAM